VLFANWFLYVLRSCFAGFTIDAAWECFARFSSFFLCVCRFIYSAGFEQNFLAWGEQNQSVPELMMQMSLVDETETACMRRVRRIGTNI